MIKANELRIGNCIKLNNSDTTLVPRDFQRYCKSFGIFEEFEPIELSEEWLLKAGFEKDDSGVDMFDQDYCEWYQKEFPVIGIICQNHDKEYIFDENTDTLRLKYVHQLQNLYFALTGSELVFSSTEP